MMGIPNWLQPTDTLAAISRGAAAGSALREQDIQTRAQDIAASEAADRLRQSYDLMAQHQDQFEAEQRAHATDAAARLAEQSANIAMQAGWHKEATEATNAANALREKHNTAMEDIYKTRNEALAKGKDMNVAVEEIAPGVRVAKGGGRWQLLTEPKGATPTILQSGIKALDAVISDTNRSEEERVNAQLLRKEAQDKWNASVLPNAPRAVAQPHTNWFGGVSTNWVPPSAMAPVATNAPSAAEQLLAPPPQESILPTPKAPKASQGGYKMGSVYGGLRYLGGDPNDESNWEPK